jgi:2-polyprenyl-6-methoxyphenol hydroxylase-like FAD-dependent oxidoreductase
MDVAIIGAGLSGLGTAIALHNHGIKSIIYEQAPAGERFAGSLMLSPNSLRILDHYGIYSRLAPQGFNFEYVDFQTNDGVSTDHQYLGSKEHFGYDALRVERNALLRELKTLVEQKGIKIRYSKKFVEIVNETDSDVTFKFADGEEVTSNLVVAADGIYSKVRRCLFPETKLKYTGILAVAGAVKKKHLKIPANEPANGPIIQISKNGAFAMAPQLPGGAEWFAGAQKPYPEQDRAGWERLAVDLKFQHEFLEEGIEGRSELVQSAIRNMIEEKMVIWPQHVLPKLPSWRSQKSKIVIIGDAAHAMPPTSGQGANQAFEDGYALAMLLAKKPRPVSEEDALAFWQEIREDRVRKLLDLTVKLNNMRTGADEQKKLRKDQLWESGGDGENLRWLYVPELDEKIDAWIKERS